MRSLKRVTIAILMGAVALATIEASASPASRSLRLKKRALRTDVSFEETYERYPAPYDMFSHIERLLPHLNIENLSPECFRLGKENSTVLGGNLPNFGAPLEDQPGALFVELYTKCLDDALRRGLFNNQPETARNFEAILGAELAKALSSGNADSTLDAMTALNGAWQSIDASLRTRILERLVFYIVGPDSVLEDKELIGANSVFGPEVRSKEDLLKHVEKVSLENSNAGPTLYGVIRGAAILLRIGPMLLN